MKRLIVWVCLVPVITLLGYMFYVAEQIERQSLIDESQPADVIVVMGAAEYRGRPSPILQQRLNHALVLYLKHMAPYVLTTGGAGRDPDFTEGEVARAYLVTHNVPAEAIITDAVGSTTVESLDAAIESMRRMNLHSCIVVSDGYHIFRVKRVLEAEGIKVFGSPKPPAGGLTKTELRWLYLRQAAGFMLWQLGINV